MQSASAFPDARHETHRVRHVPGQSAVGRDEVTVGTAVGRSVVALTAS